MAIQLLYLHNSTTIIGSDFLVLLILLYVDLLANVLKLSRSPICHAVSQMEWRAPSHKAPTVHRTKSALLRHFDGRQMLHRLDIDDDLAATPGKIPPPHQVKIEGAPKLLQNGTEYFCRVVDLRRHLSVRSSSQVQRCIGIGEQAARQGYLQEERDASGSSHLSRVVATSDFARPELDVHRVEVRADQLAAADVTNQFQS